MLLKCRKCGKSKDSSFFYKEKLTKTGYKSKCKECLKQEAKQYASSLEYNQKLKCSICKQEKDISCFNKRNRVCKDCLKVYRTINKESFSESSKKWRSKNKDKLKTDNKAYKDKNKDKLKEYSKSYENTIKRKEYKKKYYLSKKTTNSQNFKERPD